MQLACSWANELHGCGIEGQWNVTILSGNFFESGFSIDFDDPNTMSSVNFEMMTFSISFIGVQFGVDELNPDCTLKSGELSKITEIPTP